MLGPGTGQEAQRRRDVEADGKAEAEAKRPEEEHRRLPWPIRRSAPLLGCLAGVVAVCAIGAWFVLSPGRTPVAPLAAAQERALKPGDTFQECSNCPLMMVVPAGSFIMGSPAGEPGRFSNEDPQHEVTIANPFAVGQYELRFDEWDACVADGGCNGFKPPDQGWGRKDRPAINVSWVDAHAYVSWLAKKTGKPYRLLTEAEYEYATRAGTTTLYPWGDEMPESDAPCYYCASSPEGDAKANCNGCGVGSGYTVQAAVGIFPPNKFGLYDMVGNVSEWTEDCYHSDYTGAPADGAAWLQANGGDCSQRIIRGGSWSDGPDFVRSASRFWMGSTARNSTTGLRVARTLLAP
jgi:formylglycine-generating enzyme required for sulfatase activity